MWGRLPTCAAVDYRRRPVPHAAVGRLTIGRSLPSCPTNLPRRLYLGLGQVADDQVLLYLVYHDLIGLLCLASVELDRFVDVLVLLFRQLIVGHHPDGVLVLL